MLRVVSKIRDGDERNAPLVKHMNSFLSMRMQNADYMRKNSLPYTKFKLVQEIYDKHVIKIHLH
jgi:hypothetical protein